MDQEINYSKICNILRAIEAADAIATTDSPYLHSCEISGDYNDLENFTPHSTDVILTLSWNDDEGEIYKVDFTAESLSNAIVYKDSPHVLNLFDSEGEVEVIYIYDISPGRFDGFPMSENPKP